MYSKAQIFNLALGALLLTKKISNTDDDTSTECQTLNTFWPAAFGSTLADLDLDCTSVQKELELITADPNDLWLYAYKYPSDCAFFRRIQNCDLKDTSDNQIPRKVGTHNGKKVVFTNEESAIGEYISNGLNLNVLSAEAGLAVAYKLAILSSPLIVGKGALALRKELKDSYILAKAEAQETDRNENANFESEAERSELVRARIE
jgi:hypothetical protein